MLLRTKFLAVLALSALLTVVYAITLLRNSSSSSEQRRSSTKITVLQHLPSKAHVISKENQMLHSTKFPQFKNAMPSSGSAMTVTNQLKRQTLLRQFCSDRRRRHAVANRGLLRHIIYNKKLRFAYCEVGKVASSTWRAVLKLALGDDEGDLTARDSERFRPLRRLTPAVNKYFKFVFVRHPFDRLVSAFYEKFHHRKTEYWKELAPKIVRKYRIDPHRRQPQQQSSSYSTLLSSSSVGGSKHDITFDEFVRYMVDPRNESPLTDFHWSPQSSMCQLCRMRYDYVGHYETLHDDADHVLGRLGVRDRVRFPDGSRSRTRLPSPPGGSDGGVQTVNGSSVGGVERRPRRGRTVEHVRELFAGLDSDTVRRLKDFYRNDFEMFGYDANIYL